jgi:molybdopterin-guanine dinucleotide biosynthesis protein A
MMIHVCDPPALDARHCAAIILAGGLSVRYGRDKATAPWRGRRLIEHVAARLRPVARRLIAVARPQQAGDDWPVDRVVCDDPDAPAGPLRGLVAGLENCAAPFAYVVACDTPCLDPRLLGALGSLMAPGIDAVLAEWAAMPQPLVALYRASAAPRLRALLNRGERSPLRAVRALGHRLLDEAACRALDPAGRSFMNANSPADLNLMESGLASMAGAARPSVPIASAAPAAR